MLVAFRADASVGLGSGHVVRCAALALALRRVGGRSVFVGATQPGDLHGWLAAQGHEVLPIAPSRLPSNEPAWRIEAAQDADRTLAALDRLGARPDWLVVDHYGVDAAWLARCRGAAGRVLLIDDLGGRLLDADALLDVGLGAKARQQHTPIKAGGRRLYGPRHALLGPAFADLPPRRDAGCPPRLLACMGGSDPLDALGTVLAAWQRLPVQRPSLDLAVGDGSPNVDSLRARCAGITGVTLHVQTDDMARLMAGADLFIGSAGGIGWERCAAGLPAIFGATADNQRANRVALAAARTGIDLGDWARVTPERLTALLHRLLPRRSLQRRLATRAQRLVDGLGATRVALVLAAADLALRPATPADAETAFAWRNAPGTRRHAFDPRPLALPEHLDWWTRTLAEPTRELWIAQVGDLAVGVLRLDRAEADAPAAPALVSIYLDPRFTGLGLGASVLAAAQRRAAATPGRPGLHAQIAADNRASVAAFEAAGFVRSAEPRTWTWHA